MLPKWTELSCSENQSSNFFQREVIDPNITPNAIPTPNP